MPPELTAEQRAQCPPASQIQDLSIEALVRGDAELALMYRRCAARHESTVSTYDQVRQAIINFNAEVARIISEAQRR